MEMGAAVEAEVMHVSSAVALSGLHFARPAIPLLTV